MSELKRRRAVLAAGAAGMAGMAAVLTGGEAAAAAPPGVRVEVWEQEACPGCGAPVYFLPGQKTNACALPGCGAPVVRA